MRIHNGWLIKDGEKSTYVGTTASAIQSVVDSDFGEVETGPISFFDESNLRYLDLSGGTYSLDATLRLPSMFVLRMDGYDSITGFVLEESPSSSSDTFPAMTYFDNIEYTAVVGGFLNATANSG